jgi:peptidyl-prolyl cis-trans isomerase B (cyclophilin B)
LSCAVSEAGANTPDDAARCSSCGHALPAGAAFCRNCGAQAAPVVPPAGRGGASPAAARAPLPRTPPGPKRGRARAILVGALTGLILGGGVAAAILVMGEDDPPPHKAAAQESSPDAAPEDEDSSSAGAAPERTAKAPGCEPVATPAPTDVSFARPAQVLEPGARATAVVETSCGTFRIALDTQRAPRTANSFAFLAERGLYDGLGFHRVATGFVIQGGDPLGDGAGGPGYSVDERPPADLAYREGVVAMAKSASEPSGRSGSQFFVVLADDAGLPPEYALLGTVSEGADVVARIGALGTPSERPRRPVTIERISIERG